MAGAPHNDDVPPSLEKVGTFNDPYALLAAMTGTQSNTDDSDPPPPLPTKLDEPTPAEELALDDWVKRNSSYVTSVPWHRYANMSVLAWLWGYADCDFRTECMSTYLFYTRATGRRLTADERDAVLEPVTRSAAAASYDRPVALGLGSWLTARSWSKSGVQEAVRRAAEAAAAAAAAPPAVGMGLGTGTVGADGHITHFSAPAHQHTSTAGRLGLDAFGADRGKFFGTLFRRTARASVPGLLCLVGYQVLSEPYRLFLAENETESMRRDIRLTNMADEMNQNLVKRVGDIEELLRRRGF